MSYHSYKRKNGLSNTDKIMLYSSITALSVSGIIWLLMHYFVRVKTEFGSESHHYLEHIMLIIHGAFAYVFIFIFGLIWNNHIKKWFTVKKRNFKSGVTMVVIIFLLMLTGTMLYYVSSDFIRNYTSIFHSIIGVIFVSNFIIHKVFYTKQNY